MASRDSGNVSVSSSPANNWTGDIMGQASSWNTSIELLDDVPLDSNFMWLLFSLLMAIIWFTYVTYYNSRVFGQLLTRIVNRFFISQGYVKIGSLSFDALSGKLMFRDILYVTEDFCLRVQDGWMVFRWWRSYVPRGISEDLSHSDTRLLFLLNGFELHIYNRLQLYCELEKLFGLDPGIIVNEKKSASATVSPTESKNDSSSSLESRFQKWSWRDLIPVIKVDICCGRFVFGNRLVPTTLCISFEETHFVYSTKPAMSKFDLFMHVISCRAENFKVTLAPSLKYPGLTDEPPRLMGEGFVVLSSNVADFYYYMDEPGIVPEAPEMVELANGDMVESTPPMWGIDIRCGKGTDFSYGPWADRQREQLHKFFYPSNYQPLQVSSIPRPGEKRDFQSFDIRLSLLAESSVDILFSKQKETNAVHMTIGAGSCLEVTFPWAVKADGCSTKINGQFLHVEASTSLQYRSLLEAETFKFAFQSHYPLDWNAHQLWNLSLSATKATLHLMYEHRYFFQDLVNDWSSRSPNDLLFWVPYTWQLNVGLKEFEIVTVANQYNWVDCSSHNQENLYAAFSGDVLDLSFALPFTDFLPDTVPLRFDFRGESLMLNLRLPEISTSRPMLHLLASQARVIHRQSNDPEISEPNKERQRQKWSNFVKDTEDWVQCWTVPNVSLAIDYTYHPLSAPGPPAQADIPTPEREEKLLTPVRFPRSDSTRLRSRREQYASFDPTTLEPDLVNVELELGPSEVYAYGTLVRVFLNLKENIFGEDQRITDMDPNNGLLELGVTKNDPGSKNGGQVQGSGGEEEEEDFDPRICRPLHVDVSVTMHDIRAHLMKHCNEEDPYCPTVLLEKFSFEMHKTFLETKLQLVLSPLLLYSTDLHSRPSNNSFIQQGFVLLSALQLRGHALFSLAGRKPDEETIEYGWMIEIIAGQVTGRLTAPQVQHIVAGLEAFLSLAMDEENVAVHPEPLKSCHHGNVRNLCTFSTPSQSSESGGSLGILCPTTEDMKYRMTRLSVDLVDIALVETDTAITLQVYPIRFALCNLHGPNSSTGASVLIPHVKVSQYVSTSSSSSENASCAGASASGRSKSEPGVKISSSNSTWDRTQTSGWTPSIEDLHIEEKLHRGSFSNDLKNSGFSFADWLEVGVLEFGPVNIDLSSLLSDPRLDYIVLQDTFLKVHDNRTRRLWFLWGSEGLEEQPGPSTAHPVASNCCGCIGGCTFFGTNSNGTGFFDKITEYRALSDPYHEGPDLSFGQSLLRENFWLIRLPVMMNENSEILFAERSLSTSTIKNDELSPEGSGNESDSELSDDAEVNSGENTPLLRLASERSVPSEKSFLSEKLYKTKRLSKNSAAKSTPTLLEIHEGMGRKRTQFSLPSLQGIANFSAKRSLTKMNTSESQSEMFYSAEDDTSSDDELVSAGSLSVPNITGTEQIPKSRPESRSSASSSSSNISRGRISLNSAISSKEDFSLVDLHLQSSRPIVESPLLLASYVTHLSQAECTNWNLPAPPGTADFVSSTPRFTLVKSGFTASRLIDRAPSTPLASGRSFTDPQEKTNDKNECPNEVVEEDPSQRSSSTTVYVKFHGSINAMLTPLALESAQRFADSVISTMENLHPLSIITRIHRKCVDYVIGRNPLKETNPELLHQLKSPSEESHTVVEDFVGVILRGSLQLPRINICFMQAGMVEQVIALSALDNPRDLVCVSTVAVCIDSLSLYFSNSKRQRRIAHVINRPATETMLKKKSKSKSRPGRNAIAPTVYLEAALTDGEQSLVSGNLGKVHLQLRRLNNDNSPSLPDNVTVTAIPPNFSRVLFTFSGSSTDTETITVDRQLSDSQGVIMFETGLQGVALRVVRKVSSASESKQSPETDPNVQDSARSKTKDQDKTDDPSSNNDLSSCALQLKSIWFSFAAPPRTTHAKKSVQAILDWNLLSTASPTINVWMNSIDRLSVTLTQLFRITETRTMAVVAGVMAEALDAQQLHLPVKSKYNYHSLMSKALLEDPSCQLCLVLHRYAVLQLSDWRPFAARLSLSVTPPLVTLKQGVTVLSRQWKNAIYTPLMLDFSQRQAKTSKATAQGPAAKTQGPSRTVVGLIKEGKEKGDEDERTLLLEHGDVESYWLSSNESSIVLSPGDLNNSINLLASTPSSPPGISAFKRHIRKTSGLSESCEMKTLSGSSNEYQAEETPQADKDTKRDEDLYNWMARQQKSIKTENVPIKDRYMDTADLSTQQPSPLVDTHAVFAPLFASLDLESSREVFGLLSLRESASVMGSVEELRVEIFESESNSGGNRRRSKGGYRSRSSGKFLLFIPPEVPAFVCEKIVMEVEAKQTNENQSNVRTALFKPRSTTVLNFSLGIGYIAQQVNMPLLRLVHQLTNVYVNAKATQNQLREQRPIKRSGDPLRTLTVVLDSSETTPSPLTRQNPSPSLTSDNTNLFPRALRAPGLAQRLRSGTRVNKISSLEEPLLAFTPDPTTDVLNCRVENATMPKCWRTVYHLLELYASMPAANVVMGKPEENQNASALLAVDVEAGLASTGNQSKLVQIRLHDGEHVRLIVFGVMKISRVRMLAMLSGLRLEAEIVSLHSSLTYKEKARGSRSTGTSQPRVECSLTGHLGRAMIVLLEGVAPSQQTVVKVTVGKSQALYSRLSQMNKDRNSGLLSVGAVHVDIPQHPGVLHGMMTRGTKQLSSTLQEFRVPRMASRTGRNTSNAADELDNSAGNRLSHSPVKETPPVPEAKPEPSLLQPLVMQFSIMLQSLSITAALLPSLQAQYQMENVVSAGVTGSKAKFTVELPKHTLSFNTKLQINENLPSSASIDLPRVHVGAEYLQDNSTTEDFVDGVVLCRGSYLSALAEIGTFEHCLTTDLLNHLVFVQKVFMAEINDVLVKVSGGDKPVPLWEDAEHRDASSIRRLLYNLVVRLKGIQITATTPTHTAVRLETGVVELQLSNRVQNVSGSGNVGRSRNEGFSEAANAFAKLFGRAKVDLNLSLGQLIRNPFFEEAEPEFQQVAFFKTRINLRNAFQDELTPTEGGMEVADKDVVLITLTRPLIYLQPTAVDKAILVWLNYKNAYDYWTEQRSGWTKETAGDRATLGQFSNLNHLSGSHLSTLFLQLTVDDMGICMPLNAAPPPWGGAGRHVSEPDTCSAVVVTLENSSISACSSGSLVSKGRFTGLCLRFSDDFETGLDDWKPDTSDLSTMNLCVVSEGTYEVCSRTVAPPPNTTENAKWILHVGWQMEGVDTHLDTGIGKQLSALGHTLTRLTGGEEEPPGALEVENFTGPSTEDESEECERLDSVDGIEGVQLRRPRTRSERIISTRQSDTQFDKEFKRLSRRSRHIEKEMSEQARIIQDLKLLGASSATVEQEMRRLQELEAQASKDFRRVMLQRLRRQSVKASAIRDKLGLSTNLTEAASKSSRPLTYQHALHHSQSQRSPHGAPYISHQRSKSVVVPPVMSEHPGEDVTLDVNIKDIPELLLPPIESSPSGSSQTTPTSEFRPSGRHSGPHRDADRSSGSVENSSIQGGKSHGEPTVDLELDVKVFVNSGKCVLHTRDTRGEDHKRMKKEKSFSTGLLDASGQNPSPASGRKRSDLRPIPSSSRLRFTPGNTAQMAVDLTIFHIPGLDIKLYYESKTDHEETPSAAKGKHTTKKGRLFAWMTLQSIPEETIVSPHILEFLEQALEPIPVTVPDSKNQNAAENGIAGVFSFDGGNADMTPITATAAGSSGSFPVDVIVYCHVEPSTFRFSCLPVSRVECLLRLPSLHLVFSSKRAEDGPTSTPSNEPPSNNGGLSVTGFLSDFSLYIFHPYGGGKKSSAGPRRDAVTPDRSAGVSSGERKDSLSVNVEFVKFQISRSRKVKLELREYGPVGRTGRDSAVDTTKAIIRFSTIVDIGSASFKYDMRRLPEILAFPKAWYRRSIVRRLFLGDLSKSDPSELLPSSGRDLTVPSGIPRWAELQTDYPGAAPTTSWETLVVFVVNFTKLNVLMNMGNVMGNVSWLTKDFKAEGRLSIGSTGHKDMFIGVGLGGSSLDAKGGIVGGTIELSGIQTSLQIQEDPGIEPDHRADIKLHALECRLDYMGTSVLMGRVSELSAELRDEWRINGLSGNRDRSRSSLGSSPTKRPAMIFIHGDLAWGQLQLLISKSTTADLIKMYLKLVEFFQQQFRSSRRIFSTFSTGSVKRKVQSKISKTNPDPSTAPQTEVQYHRHWQDVLRKVSGLHIANLPTSLPATGTILGGTMELHGEHISLACFHGVNFKSKSWALFSLKDPCISFATEAQEIPGEDPKDIHVVQNLSFSLGLASAGPKTPNSVFRTTEYIQQQHSPTSMATVCRISRTQLFPPQFRTLQDWFLYAFANSRLDAVDKFPSLERERERSTSGAAAQPHPVKPPDYNHTAEVIFAFPSLQLHLKSEQMQTGNTPNLNDVKPMVECSLITDFEDHILVTVDAEAFFFLHDLISSYVREKERVISTATTVRTQSPELSKAAPAAAPAASTASSSAVGPVAASEDDKKRKILEQIDWREFQCKTWHLEPTVRLLSWAGKRIEPYGVDYILHKLGFSHARITIPKWVQRGAMDPLDKLLSAVLLRTIAAQRKNDTQTKH